MTVAVERERCLNDNYKRIACRRCADACPSDCFGDTLAVDERRCDRCGLCLAACPADAVLSDDFPRAPLDTALADPAEPVALACRRRREGSPWPCLGFLDGRLLLALVFSGGGQGRRVAVDDAACAACRPEVAARLEEIIVEANRLLLMAGKTPLLRGEEAGPIAAKEKPISRRAFFSAILGATLETVREVATAGSAGAERLPRHEWYARHVGADAFAGETPSPFFTALAIGDACLACGLCLRICPARAITADDRGDALDFYHQPDRCTGCGLCAAHCPQQALVVTAGGRPSAYHVARRDMPRCAGCGMVYQPVGSQQLCIECLLKGNRKGILPDIQEDY